MNTPKPRTVSLRAFVWTLVGISALATVLIVIPERRVVELESQVDSLELISDAALHSIDQCIDRNEKQDALTTALTEERQRIFDAQSDFFTSWSVWAGDSFHLFNEIDLAGRPVEALLAERPNWPAC